MELAAQRPGTIIMRITYAYRLKRRARRLRGTMTDAELKFWQQVRHEQLGVRFFRQRPVHHYIVDFYCPRARLVVEIDGGQHFELEGLSDDRRRDACLARLGLEVLRFDNRQILFELDGVMERVVEVLERRGLMLK
jgi:very-short-patch-repair endonuclease